MDNNVHLHKRVAAAIAQGRFTSHNMRESGRESDKDGDQDLTFWIRSSEEVLRKILGDTLMEGHEIYLAYAWNIPCI